MIVDDFDLERGARLEAEADAPLVVDTDAVLAFAIAMERLQMVARRCSQVLENYRRPLCQ